jgi:hypothetical protein
MYNSIEIQVFQHKLNVECRHVRQCVDPIPETTGRVGKRDTYPMMQLINNNDMSQLINTCEFAGTAKTLSSLPIDNDIWHR